MEVFYLGSFFDVVRIDEPFIILHVRSSESFGNALSRLTIMKKKQKRRCAWVVEVTLATGPIKKFLKPGEKLW